MREEEDREINHHGRSVNVDQTQRRQNEPVEARNPEEEIGETNGEENEQIRKTRLGLQCQTPALSKV